MTTSLPLQQSDLFGMVSASHGPSSARRPVRTSARPTPKAKASTGRAAGSTLRPSGLSENVDLVGSLLKTALISELAALTESSLSWRPSATPSGHSWFVLQTSGPTTNADEAGSSGLMPTPRASDMKAGGHGDTGRMGTVRHVMQVAQGLLPTPTKRDNRMDKWSPAYEKRHSPSLDAMMDGAARSLTQPGKFTPPDKAKWEYACQIAVTLSANNIHGHSQALPVTYGWIMGFPPGWLARALQSAVHAGHLQQVSSSKRSATQSSRRSRKQ